VVKLAFEKTGGLIPAIAQDYETGEILMLAYMNQEAWEQTLHTGKATYFSRSRQKLWVKGNTSGNLQVVKNIRVDCDDDTVLLEVEQLGGAACHTGHRSCFFKRIQRDGSIDIVGKPVFDPKEVYGK
jgi:phosphoribosyl-AMP cyclohydrolase